jgi:hypothetical protein
MTNYTKLDNGELYKVVEHEMLTLPASHHKTFTNVQ